MKSLFPHSRSQQAGFTLVELMVALSLFIIVVLALVSSLYSVNDASRKVQAMRAVMDNLNFAMESMSRTIRTGTDFRCDDFTSVPVTPVSCPLANGGQHSKLVVVGTLGANNIIEYRHVLDTQTGKGRIEKRTRSSSGAIISDWISITAPEIDIQTMKFFVDGADPTDKIQPSVVIMLEGVATASTSNTAPFAIQTYLSQRASE